MRTIILKIISLLFVSFPLTSLSFDFFENRPKQGYELKNWKMRIGAYPTKNANPIYLSEITSDIPGLKEYNSKEWKEIDFPIKYERISAEKPLVALSFLTTFKLSELNLDYQHNKISLHIPYFTIISDVYLNGQLIASFGKVNFENQTYEKMGFRRHALVVLPTNLLREENELIFVVYTLYPYNLNVEKKFNDVPFEINYFEEHIKIHIEAFTFMLSFLYLFVGLYHLLLYSKRPKERYNLWFGLFSVFISFYYVTRSNYIYVLAENLGIDSLMILRLDYSSIFLTSIWGLLFYEEFHYLRLTLFAKIISSIILLYTISVWLFDYYVASLVLSYWQKTTLVILVYALGIVVYYSVKKNQDSIRLLIGMMIFVSTAVLDILGAMGIGLFNYQLARYGFFAFVIGIAFVLANKFLRVYQEVEELNVHLEEKVKERTAELQLSLDEIRRLKEQQDGDYFLTSLLVQPLIFNDVNSEVVGIQTYLKQKKEFQFKKWHREIGGDVIITQSINLKQRPYVFVFNGDAMGKSLQGAGGSLVAGVIIKSILTRTILYSEYQNRYPEKWLKELFIELHNVFESFDGSMLLSGFLGLIDEQTGTLYYVYAEHPYPVLYRKNRAEFLDQQTEFKKFGTPGLVGKVYILMKELKPGDMVFVGSDGKDDILFSLNGKEAVNEDETLFLRIIEESQGDLQKIVENIASRGKIIDDISIVKITYKEDIQDQPHHQDTISSEIKSKIRMLQHNEKWNELLEYIESLEQSYHSSQFLYKEMILTNYKLENYQKTIQLGEDYLNVYPYDNDVLIRVARSYLLSKNYSKAFEHAERLYIRDPNNVSNLILMINCCHLLGDNRRAVKILNQLLTLAPEKEETKKLRKMLLGS
ncbi:MAG: SpoIIE family protein phosphatase [Leptospiraceae bacterium]|nr:SpoIIE family protein phosphatase [Leptospiraceae bacterium]MDW7976385.1 SpoIIE family protein phosphatase [Leptospiraceae bacterium]